jgi:trans-aconitate methyltransferase
MSENEVWQKYSVATANLAARPRLLETLNIFFPFSVGQALDFGCGSGRDTKELLKRGWSVDALDSNKSALNMTAKLQTDDFRLNLIHSSFEAAVLKEKHYDLINASASIPFCSPKDSPMVWWKILNSIKPGGFISCDFFGMNDEWNSGDKDAMSFLSRSDIESFLAGWKIEQLIEKEMLGPTALGGSKHWHIFTCIARRISFT